MIGAGALHVLGVVLASPRADKLYELEDSFNRCSMAGGHCSRISGDNGDRVGPERMRAAYPFLALILLPAAFAGQVPDYRNGKANVLVCPDNHPCFQTDHETAKRLEKLYDLNRWHGDIWYLPLNKKP